MRLHLDRLGFIPPDYPRIFWRVENGRTGHRIADFDNAAEAYRFAAENRRRGELDQRVARMTMTGA